MQSIISKGKNIEDAVRIGLEILETTKENVIVEIMNHESKGFLGIGSKNAVVKITKSEQNESTSFNLIEESHHSSEKNGNTLEMGNSINRVDHTKDQAHLQGKVWIKNEKLYSQCTTDFEPTVTIHPNIRLYKNNELVKEKTTIISELDAYELKVEDEEKETVWEVKMDEHKLKVHLFVEPGYKLIRSIPDTEAKRHLKLDIIEEKEFHHTLNSLDVMQKLQSLKVTYGMNQSEILKAIDASENGTFEIASGMEPTQGKDGWIELKVDSEVQTGPKEREDGRVDFREIYSIPCVESGEMIGIIHPPQPGQPGRTVGNELIPPKEVFPITLEIGKGVAIEDGKILATESGRLHIEQKGYLAHVKVIQKLIHNDNVNLTSGNIHFIGDVEIMGEVESNMIIEAEGDIIIQKTVNNALLSSSGGFVAFGNIIGSEILAGRNNRLVSELGNLLGMVHQNVENMIVVMKQLTNSTAFKTSDFSRGGLQPLIRILLEKKFVDFPQIVKKYLEAVENGEKFLKEESWKKVGVSLSQVFLTFTNEVNSIDRITHVSQKIKDLIDYSHTPVELDDSYMTIPSAYNSKLYCSGNILVLGQGSVNSKIHADGMLKISGVIRGGEVFGRLGVEINESGAESGTATMIAVPGDQSISIQKAMEGTTIMIGNVKYTFKETRHHIVARLDEYERIIFE